MVQARLVSPPPALWPPDDTEESILGVDRHQLDIASLRLGVNEEAHRLAGVAPLPFQAITQILLLGCVRRNRTDLRVLPDVMVFPRAMDITRGSYSLGEDSPPVLVIEVASASTVAVDRDLARGKGWSYAHAGIAEYLVLDPPGTRVPGRGEGWRLDGGVYRPWAPGADGHWHSRVVPVAVGVEDDLAAVYRADGRRNLREGEIGAALEAERRQSLLEGRMEGERAGRLQGELVGRLEGALAGKREAVRRVARLRFGVHPALEQRLDAADSAELDRLLDRLLAATGPEDL